MTTQTRTILSPDVLWAMLPRTVDALARDPDAKAGPSDEEVTAFVTRRALLPLPGAMRAGVRDGVGVLPIFGPIRSRQQWQQLALDFGALLEAPNVRAILLDIDSPGGIVTGTQEMADLVFESRGRMPIVAYIAGMGASAGYWVAAAADQVLIAETGEAGSIGVAALYVDWSKFDERVGIREVEIISSQSPKKRALPTNPEGKALIQARVDALADVFIDRVARYRGVTRDTVLADFGQGDLIVGEQAVDAGLADGIGSFDQLLSDLSSASLRRNFTMTARATKLEAGIYRVSEAGAEPQAITIDRSFILTNHAETAEALREEGRAEVRATAESSIAAAEARAKVPVAEAVAVERARIGAILTHEAAATRGDLARTLALESDLGPEAAGKILAAAPEVAKPAPDPKGKTPFEQAMERVGDPDIGADGGEGGEGDDANAEAARVLALFQPPRKTA